MTSPSGDIFARLKAELVPDPTGFRQKTQKIVDATEDSLDPIEVGVELTGAARIIAQMKALAQAAATDIPVGVDVQGIGVAEAALARLGQFDFGNIAFQLPVSEFQAINNNINEMAKGFKTIEVPEILSVDELRRIGANLDEQLARPREITVGTFLDPDALKLVRNSLLDFAHELAVEANDRFRLRPSLDFDFNDLASEFAQDIGFRLHPEIDNAAIARASAQLAAFFRGTFYRITPVVDNAAMRLAGMQLARLSGARVATDEIEKMYRAFQNLDRALPTISLLTTGIIGLIGYLGTAVSNVFALGASLAQIAPLALALPALFAAAGVSVGVFIAAFKDFNTVFPGVRDQLSALQDQISSNFWAEATAGVQAFLDAPWEDFQAGITETATALGAFTGQLATDLAAGLDIGPMFASLNAGIAVLAGATGPLTNIFQILGEAGSSIIPLLSEKFVGLTETFSNWLSGKGVGGMAEIFENAIFQVGELFRALGGLGNILSGIANAATAAGGSTLTVLADTLDRVAEVVNSPAFQGVLINFFSAAHQAMSNIALFSGPAIQDMFLVLAQTLTTVLPLVGTTIGIVFGEIAQALSDPRLQQGFIALIQGISTGLTALAPALGPVAAAFGELGSFIGELAANLGPVLGVVFTVLAESLQGILPAIQPLIPILGGALIAVVRALAPVVEQLAGAFAVIVSGGVIPLIASALQALVPVISTLAPIIATVLLTALEALTPLFPIIATVLAQIVATVGNILGPILIALSPILEALIQVIVAVVQAVMPFVSVILELINAAIGPLLPVIVQLINLAMTPLLEALGFLLPIIQLLGEGLLWVVENVINPWVMPVIVMLAEFLSAILGPAIESIGKIFSAVWQLVQDVWDAFSLLFEGDILGFINAIGTAFAGFSAKIKEIFKELWDKIVSGVKDAWNTFRDTTEEKVGDAIAIVKGLPGKALEALGNLRTKLIQAGKDLLDGFIDGITNKIQDVRNTLTGLTDSLTSWKGPESRDRTLLEPAGELIIAGLLRGLESGYGDVRKSLGGLSDEFGGMKFRAPTVMSGALSALASLVGTDGASGGRTFNYYAAPGSSINSEEDLFAAVGRGRAFGGF